MNKHIKRILVLATFIPSFALAQTAVTADSVGSSIDCAAISHNLKLGSRDSLTGGDVTTLQIYLSQANYLDSDPTGYFGRATRKAVMDFQTANGIAAQGNVGPYTRAKIKEISCVNGVTSTTSTGEHMTTARTESSPTTDTHVTGSTPSTARTEPTSGSQSTGDAKVDIKVNGSDGPVTLTGEQIVQVDWTTTGVTNCRLGTSSMASTSVATSGRESATVNPTIRSYLVLACNRQSNGETVYDYVKMIPPTTSVSTTVPNSSIGMTPIDPSSVAKVDLKINGFDTSVMLNGAQPMHLDWTTTGVTGCQIEVSGVATTDVPLSGSQTTTLNPTWTSYVVLSCKRTNNGEIIRDYVKVLPVTTTPTTTQPVSTETPTTPTTSSVTTQLLPSVKVVSPNGGESYAIDGDMKVYWSFTALPTGGYFVTKLIGEGKEIVLGTGPQQAIVGTTGTDHFPLSVSSSITAGKYKVRVNLMSGNGELVATDISDDYMTVGAH